MSETTNLKLFKHNEPLETNENQFDVDLALNQNWDKIDDAYGNLNTDIENLQTNDSKQDELISKLKNALINVETEESKSIHVEDASTIGQLEVLGNQEQETSLYNGNLEQGSISESGPVDASNRIRTAEYIEVKENTEINVSADGANEYILVFYNSNKEYIQSSPWANLGTDTAIIANSQFVKVLLRKIDNSNITVSDVSNFIVGPTPSPDYPSPVKCLGSNKNIYDDSTSATNQRLSTGSGGTYAQTGYSVSGYIEILPNQYLIINTDYNSHYCFYNAEKQYISGDSFKNTKRIINSSNAKYIKFDFKTEDKNNIKLEYGSQPTSYSPYNQGSTKISKINKNIYDIAKYPFTNRIAYNLSGEQVFWGGYCGILDYFPVKGNTQYTFSNNLNKPIYYGLVFYNKDKQVISAISTNTTTFTTPENCKYIRFAIQSDTLPTWVQIEVGNTATSNVEHQQTDYILNIQQEMLSGDYFIKEADGWKEVHGWNKLIFTGTERFQVSSLKNTRMVLLISNAKQNPEEVLAVSNSFLSVTYNQVQQNNLINAIYVNNSYLSIDTDEITSVTEFKQILADKYNAGNPIYAFYKLATSTKLSCTKEQSAVLEELSNMDLFEGVNNIITAEDIALLKLKYALDVETYVDNKLNTINQQILEIAGGN